MSQSPEPPEIFDRRRRRALRERAARRGDRSFLWDYVAAECADRLSLVIRDFPKTLIIGPLMHHATAILANRAGIVEALTLGQAEVGRGGAADEDMLPFAPGSFDLVLSGGTLDSVNDLPGALVQIRRVLKPDGLFLGHMFGAGTLATLKSLMLAAEGDAATPHVHPQIDLRSAADLMARAGFALPVADGDTMPVRYGGWRSIVADIRDAGIGNALAGRRHYLGKDMPKRLDTEWRRRAATYGKVEERFAHIFLSGWAPSTAQPKPAQRGSGEVSLAAILKPTASR
jgi:SAM-dependent methyltransferase